MPSIPSRGGIAPVLLVVLASLAVVLPVTVVAGAAAPGPDASGSGPPDVEAASGVPDPSLAGAPACTPAPERGSGVPSSVNRVSSASVVGTAGANETGNATVHLGEVAAVGLSVPPGENVTVEVGSSGRYHANLRVGDDGDGRVTLLVNTFVAANQSTVTPETFRADGADQVTVTGGLSTQPLEPGEQPVTARHDGGVVAERTLTVLKPAVNGVTVRRAAPRVYDASNASAIREANRSGLVRPLRQGEQRPEAVAGETLVVRVDAPSLLGVLAAQPGNTTTKRLLGIQERTNRGAPETFEFWGPCGGILLAESANAGAVRTVAASGEGAVYVLVATDRVEGIPEGGAVLDLEAASPLVDEERRFEAGFSVVDRELTVHAHGETVPLAASESVVVSGETDLPPGSEVPVRVESLVDPAFERRATATVAEDGTFVATLDLSNASDPGVFTVNVDGERYRGTIGDPPDVYWELATPVDPAHDVIQVRDLALPEDGLLVAYEYDTAHGTFRPVGTALWYETDLPVEDVHAGDDILVAAHRDGDGNGRFDGPATDPPLRVGGQPVVEWVEVRGNAGEQPAVAFDPSEVTTATPAPTATPEDSPTPTASPVGSGSATESPQTTVATASPTGMPADGLSTELPGFGLTTGILAVVVGLALLAGHRGRR